MWLVQKAPQWHRHPPWVMLKSSYLILNHMAFWTILGQTMARGHPANSIWKHAWPYQVRRFKVKSKSLCWWITHMAGAARVRKGDEQHKSQAMSLALSLKHLIRMAGTLRLPTEQVKRHPDVKSPRPSGSDHIKLSCKPERTSNCVRVRWRTREMKLFIQVYSSSRWLQVYIIWGLIPFQV